MQSLSSIGITTNPKTRLLSVDDDNLTKALTENAADVTHIFSSTDGTIQNRTNGLNSSVKSLQDQYDRTSLAIDNRMATMRAQQFTNLDLLVAQMNNTANYLAQQLPGLNNNKSN